MTKRGRFQIVLCRNIYIFLTDLHNKFPKNISHLRFYKVTVADLKEIVMNVEEKYLTLNELRTLLNYGLVYEEFPLAVLYYIHFYSGCRVVKHLLYNLKI